MLLEKGRAELRAKRPYEAIRTTGRILTELYKEESRGKMISALFLCAQAYESVGLLWAARGALLLAASIAADEWWKHSTIHPALERAVRRLKWVELQLGRIPQVLSWHDDDIALQEALVLEGYLNGRFVERILRFCTEHGSALRAEQSRIESAAGMRYPLMKLADMYFWQIGYEAAASQTGAEPEISD